MTHLWVRAEERPNEERVGLTPEGAATLIRAGFELTVEDSPTRAIPTQGYHAAGAAITPAGSWRQAPGDAVIFGLKELAEDESPLPHRHIMFGHAYKGQPAGQTLLRRFKAGGGTLYDLEYLVDDDGRRVAAFGYWAGYAGAAVALLAWAAQQSGKPLENLRTFDSSRALLAHLQTTLPVGTRPTALIIGALGRVGSGAGDLCAHMGVPATPWDMQETAHGGPFPEILQHEIFLNCILARPGTPVFVPPSAPMSPRKLTVIGDIACDPGSNFNPIPIYDRTTTWETPTIRIHDIPPLDVTAIDNLPSLLPIESSEDYAAQLLPYLFTLKDRDNGVWARAKAEFDRYIKEV